MHCLRSRVELVFSASILESRYLPPEERYFRGGDIQKGETKKVEPKKATLRSSQRFIKIQQHVADHGPCGSFYRINRFIQWPQRHRR